LVNIPDESSNLPAIVSQPINSAILRDDRVLQQKIQMIIEIPRAGKMPDSHHGIQQIRVSSLSPSSKRLMILFRVGSTAIEKTLSFVKDATHNNPVNRTAFSIF
jgi:hypothetical protein